MYFRLLGATALLAATMAACGGGGGGGATPRSVAAVTTPAPDISKNSFSTDYYCEEHMWWEWKTTPFDDSKEYRDPVIAQGSGVSCPGRLTRDKEGNPYIFSCGVRAQFKHDPSDSTVRCFDSFPGGAEIQMQPSKVGNDGNPMVRVTIYIVDAEELHRDDVEEVLLANIRTGSADVITRLIPMTFSTVDPNSELKRFIDNTAVEGSLLSASINPILQQAKLIMQALKNKDMYVVRAAGNIGTDKQRNNVLYAGNMVASEPVADFKELGKEGRLVIAAGLANTGDDLHADSVPCGIAGDFCILAYFEVRMKAEPPDSEYVVKGGTSFSQPIVAAAIAEISRVFGIGLGKSIQVMFRVARTMPGCPKDRCGRGALDLTKLFDSDGKILACLTNVDYCLRGTSSSGTVRKGLLVLPGLDEYIEILAINEHVGVPFNIVTNAQQPGLDMDAPDMDLQVLDNGLAFSSDSSAICRQEVCVFASESGLTGMRWSFAANDHCYAAHNRDDGFFGGYGTGSLAFGPSDYLHLGCAAKRELGNRLELSAGVDLAYAKARDGEVVKDLQGTLARPKIGLTHSTKTTYGGKSTLSLDLSYNKFSGSFNANLNERRLKSSKTEVGLTWKHVF